MTASSVSFRRSLSTHAQYQIDMEYGSCYICRNVALGFPKDRRFPQNVPDYASTSNIISHKCCGPMKVTVV